MADSIPTSQKKDNITKGLIIALGVVFVLAGVGYYAAKSGLSKADAETQLAAFNDSLAEYGKKRGYNIKLSYDGLEIHGGIFNKKAELKNAVLSVEPTRDDTFYTTMTIKTPKAEVSAKDSGFNSFTVTLPDPVTILSEEGTSQATFAEPLSIDVDREPTDTGTLANYEASLPPSMTFTRADQSTSEIAFGENSSMSGMVNLSASNYSHETQINTLKVLEEGETVSAASVRATIESGLQDKEFMKHQNFEVKELAFEGPRAALGKLNITADIESDAPEKSSKAGDAPVEEAAKDVSVNELKVEAADQSFAVSAKGQLAAAENEIIPQGQLAVNIDKPKTLIEKLNQAGLINPLMEKIAYTVLPKIDTAWNENSEKASFTLKRHAAQPLYVGDLSFEELTAQVLTGLLQQSNPAAGLESQQGEVSEPKEAQEAPKLEINEEELNQQLNEKMKELEQQLQDQKQQGQSPMTPEKPSVIEGAVE